MVNRRYYEKLGGFAEVQDELKTQIGSRQTDILLDDAVSLCNALCEKYKELPKKEKLHTERMIFPRVAVYLQMTKYISREEATRLIEKSVTAGVEPDRRRLHALTKIPFIRPLFFKICPMMVSALFNEKAGFKTKTLESDDQCYRVNVLQCPYAKYCGLLGCEELTSSFCLSDDRVFGNMCGIAFARQGTIGRGSEQCDFCFRRVHKE